VFGCTALAQEPSPHAATPAEPVLAADGVFGPSHAMLPTDGPAGAEGGSLSGNHNFPGFINWLGNPVQNIDPRAVTAIYPIFGSSWFSTISPVPDCNLQVYGAAVTVALSDRLAVGLNQGATPTCTSVATSSRAWPCLTPSANSATSRPVATAPAGSISADSLSTRSSRIATASSC
jgi:hypothetical protein